MKSQYHSSLYVVIYSPGKWELEWYDYQVIMKHNLIQLLTSLYVKTLLNIEKKFNIQPEIWLVLVFFFVQTFITSNKQYLVLIIVYGFLLFLKTRNILTTFWILLLSIIPFRKAKYFNYYLPGPFGDYMTLIPIFISFADIILFLLLYVAFRQRINSQKLFSLVFIVFLGVLFSLFSAFFSHFPLISVFGSFQLLKFVLIFIITIIVTRFPRNRTLTFQVLLAVCIYTSALIIAQKMYGSPIGLPIESLNEWSLYGKIADEMNTLYRPGGIMDDPNYSASYLTMIIPFLFSYLIGKSTKAFLPKKLILTLIFLCGTALIFTASRAMWISTFLVCFLVFFIAKKKNNIDLTFISSRSLKIMLLGISIGFSPFIINRLVSLGASLDQYGGGTYRLQHFKLAYDLFRQYPILGTGINTFQYEITYRYKPEEYFMYAAEPHNFIAQIASELGLAGMFVFPLTFVYFLIKPLKKYLIRKDPIYLGMFSMIFGYILALSFYPWFIYPGISEVGWIIAGIAFYERKNRKFL